MKIPRFLFEDTDIAALEAALHENVKKDESWVILTRQDWIMLRSMIEGRDLTDPKGLSRVFMLAMAARAADLWEKAKSVADQAATLGLIMQLGSLREDLPRRLVQLLAQKTYDAPSPNNSV